MTLAELLKALPNPDNRPPHIIAQDFARAAITSPAQTVDEQVVIVATAMISFLNYVRPFSQNVRYDWRAGLSDCRLGLTPETKRNTMERPDNRNKPNLAKRFMRGLRDTAKKLFGGTVPGEGQQPELLSSSTVTPRDLDRPAPELRAKLKLGPAFFTRTLTIAARRKAEARLDQEERAAAMRRGWILPRMSAQDKELEPQWRQRQRRTRRMEHESNRKANLRAQA